MRTLPQESVQEDDLLRQRVLVSEDYVVKTMPPLLGAFDMTATYLLIIFFITNAPTAAAGGPAAFTYLLLGGITFFIPYYARVIHSGLGILNTLPFCQPCNLLCS